MAPRSYKQGGFGKTISRRIHILFRHAGRCRVLFRKNIHIKRRVISYNFIIKKDNFII